MIHDLDKDVAEYAEFKFGGHTYKLRYPSMDEVEEARDKLKKNELTDDQWNDWLYGFIEPVSEGAPSMKDALKKANVKKAAKFNIWIQQEFSGA